jgi:hypothetical protein
MGESTIKGSLDALAQERGAGERDLWPSVRGRVQPASLRGTAQQSEWLPLPHGISVHKRRGFNFGMVGLVMLLVTLGAALVFVVQPVMQGTTPHAAAVTASPTAVSASPTSQTSVAQVSAVPVEAVKWKFKGHDNIYRLSTPIGLQQRIGPITVTLDHAYADANSLVIFYSVEHPSDQEYVEFSWLFVDGGEIKYHVNGDRLTTSAGDFGGEPILIKTSQFISFDASSLSSSLERHKLRLVIDMVEEAESKRVMPTVYATSQSMEDMVAGLQAFSKRFSFDLEVPVTRQGTRVLELKQRMVANGETLTLERVVITPSEFRATFKYEGSESGAGTYIRKANVWLTTGDTAFDSQQQTPPLGVGHRLGLDGHNFVHMLVWPFADMSGEWTLNVYGFDVASTTGAAPPATYPPARAVTGPWAFKFTVPPANEKLDR